MSGYELLVFFHVAFAIVWLGAGVAMTLLVVKAQRSGDHQEMSRLSEQAEWLTPRLFIPASLLTLLFGIAVVLDGPWAFDMLFVDLGLGGFAATFLFGIGYIEPMAKRLTAAVEEHGPTSAEAMRYGQRIALATRLDAVLLFGIVFVMATKPSSEDTWMLAGLAGAIVAAWLVLAAVSRPRVPEAAAVAAAE